MKPYHRKTNPMSIKPNKAIAPDESPIVFSKYASPKLDGIRGLLQEDTVLTKSMKELPNKVVREMFSSVQGLDGEFIWGAPNAPDVCNRTFSAVMTIKGTADNLMYYAFDTLDLALTFEQRYDKLLSMPLPGFIKVVPQTLLNNQAELDEMYEKVLADGYEGLMLRKGSALYKQGRATARSQEFVKIKPFLDSEAIVVEVFEAMENQNEAFINEAGHTDRSSHRENLVGKGMAGGFVVRMGDKVFSISAGSLTHAERIEVWLNRDKYVGRLLTFRHLPIGEKDVPRHGRFKSWRSPLDM